jgi:hypothetical protein
MGSFSVENRPEWGLSVENRPEWGLVLTVLGVEPI